jgi:hypothetical protein
LPISFSFSSFKFFFYMFYFCGFLVFTCFHLFSLVFTTIRIHLRFELESSGFMNIRNMILTEMKMNSMAARCYDSYQQVLMKHSTQ